MSLQRPLPGDTDVHGIHPPVIYVQEELVWQYKHIAIDLEEGSMPGEVLLNELGFDRWELNCMVTHEGFLHVYFKRLKNS